MSNSKFKAVIGGVEVELDMQVVNQDDPLTAKFFVGADGHWLPAQAALRCDCGAEKCRTTHADWCSTKRK